MERPRQAIHADQIDGYGGSHGVRDHGLLEAALYRSQTGYYTGLIEEAAALWESLAQNHPFTDRNKRTAFAVTYTFLAINGMRLTADAQQAYVFIAGLYQANQFHFNNLVRWLRQARGARSAAPSAAMKGDHPREAWRLVEWRTAMYTGFSLD